MSKKKDADEKRFVCPVGRFFMSFEGKGAKKSPFFEHISKSGLEFLKAVRSLVDERIESLERKEGKEGCRTATKIEVE
jgi:hypothetical protein